MAKNMSILIHACCADCLLKLLAVLKQEAGAILQESSILFYNPNIYPREEYQARLKAVKTIALEEKIKLIVPNYKPQEYFETIGGIESDFEDELKSDFSRVIMPKQKLRCQKCWNLRLNFLFKMAKARDFTIVTSTLLSSNYQNQNEIRKIALSLAKKYQIEFHEVNEIDHGLKTCGFYKQNYCGCLFSLIEKSREKYAASKINNPNPKYSKSCG